jgi:hypothetical protein
MSKKLNEVAMQSELSGSAFFGGNKSTTEPAVQETTTATENDGDNPRTEETTASAGAGTATPRHRGTTRPVALADKTRIETIRKAVRQLGKEDATYRFTLTEKKGLADLVYTYHVAGIKTSQNEITRIGVNWLLEDYRENGKLSVLARVLSRLND